MDYRRARECFSELLSSKGVRKSCVSPECKNIMESRKFRSLEASGPLSGQLFQLVLASFEFDRDFYQKILRYMTETFVLVPINSPGDSHILNSYLDSIRVSGVYVNFDIFLASLEESVAESYRKSMDSVRSSNCPPISYKYLDLLTVLSKVISSTSHSYLLPIVQCILLLPIISIETVVFLCTILEVASLYGAEIQSMLAATEKCLLLGDDVDREFIYQIFENVRYIKQIRNESSDFPLFHIGIPRFLRTREIINSPSKFDEMFPLKPLYQERLDSPASHVTNFHRESILSMVSSEIVFSFPTSLILQDSLAGLLNLACADCVSIQKLRSIKVLLTTEVISIYQSEDLIRGIHLPDVKSFWSLNKSMKGPAQCDSLLTKIKFAPSWQVGLFHNQLRCLEGYSYERILKKYEELVQSSEGHHKVRVSLARYLDCIIHSKNLSTEYWKLCVSEYSMSASLYTRMKTPIISRIMTILTELSKSSFSGLQDLVCQIIDSASKYIPFHVRSSVFYLVSLLKFKNVYIQECSLRLIKIIMCRYPCTIFWYLIGSQKSTGSRLFDHLQNPELLQRLTAYNNFASKMLKFNGVKDHDISDHIKAIQLDDYIVAAPLESLLGLKMPIDDEDHYFFISKTLPFFDVMKSLQRPIKLWFQCSNGQKLPLLLKFNDEIRKDNRVLDLMSHFSHLKKGVSFKSILKVYSAMPLSDSSGLIEWIDGIQTIRQITNTYSKRSKRDFDMTKTKNSLQAGQEGLLKLIAAYPPVLHVYFYETFLTSNEWLIAKHKFASSSAGLSVIGYYLGLGDRHTENILIDSSSGVCVHVDFSCLFDKAKFFEVPETVPFRFTQNIEKLVTIGDSRDAFEKYGATIAKIGKEGEQHLIGLLDSFLCDPLIEWRKGSSNIDEKKLSTFVRRRMNGAYDEVNSTNSEKVFFLELLAIASSTENLSKMYFGWAPFV